MKIFLRGKAILSEPNFVYIFSKVIYPKYFLFIIRYIYVFIYVRIYFRIMRLISINDIFKIFRFKYRKQVVKLSNSIKSVEIKTDFFKNINYKSLQLNESVAIPDKIKIASGSINMTNALYNHDFDDNEDFFSIHRFVWLLLSLDEGVSKIKIDWVQTQILKWCLQYEDKFDDKRVFEPYSVSERLVSWCYILIFVGEYIKDIKFWKIIRIHQYSDRSKNRGHGYGYSRR